MSGRVSVIPVNSLYGWWTEDSPVGCGRGYKKRSSDTNLRVGHTSNTDKAPPCDVGGMFGLMAHRCGRREHVGAGVHIYCLIVDVKDAFKKVRIE